MMLNREEIVNKGVIENLQLESENLRNASYDLTARVIIDMDGKEHDFYKLPPQGMAYVIFKEKVNLSSKIIGFAHVKTSLTQRGIMATNIGIVDPGYNGYMSTLLINFGNTYETINAGSKCLRLTFSEIGSYKSIEEKLKDLDEDAYFKERRRDTDRLDQKFLNLTAVNEEVFKKVIKALIGVGIIFAAGSFLMTAYFQSKASSNMDLQNAIRRYEERTNDVLQESKRLNDKIIFLEQKLSPLPKSKKK